MPYMYEKIIIKPTTDETYSLIVGLYRYLYSNSNVPRTSSEAAAT